MKFQIAKLYKEENKNFMTELKARIGHGRKGKELCFAHL